MIELEEIKRDDEIKLLNTGWCGTALAAPYPAASGMRVKVWFPGVGVYSVPLGCVRMVVREGEVVYES